MTTESILGVSVNPRANVYFDGKCISHSLTRADGSRLSVGVILPATLHFSTGAPERMECVAGACEYRLAGADAWHPCATGESFAVPGQSAFDIRVSEVFHYICHFD